MDLLIAELKNLHVISAGFVDKIERTCSERRVIALCMFLQILEYIKEHALVGKNLRISIENNVALILQKCKTNLTIEKCFIEALTAQIFGFADSWLMQIVCDHSSDMQKHAIVRYKQCKNLYLLALNLAKCDSAFNMSVLQRRIAFIDFQCGEIATALYELDKLYTANRASRTETCILALYIILKSKKWSIAMSFIARNKNLLRHPQLAIAIILVFAHSAARFNGALLNLVIDAINISNSSAFRAEIESKASALGELYSSLMDAAILITSR